MVPVGQCVHKSSDDGDGARIPQAHRVLSSSVGRPIRISTVICISALAEMQSSNDLGKSPLDEQRGEWCQS